MAKIIEITAERLEILNQYRRIAMVGLSRNPYRLYCFDGVVLDTDKNAAQNILARHSDCEIHRYLPYKQVKTILSERSNALHWHKERLGLLKPGSSYVPESLFVFLSVNRLID